MLYQGRIDRAIRHQKEEKEKRQVYNEGHYEPEMEDVMEKGDMFAMIFSAFITIVPAALAVLLVMVFVTMLFFHMF